ncbi:MAG TPA: hypothetical protein VGG77_16040 [Roseiarcus sp.]|jgi:hypothetical protein
MIGAAVSLGSKDERLGGHIRMRNSTIIVMGGGVQKMGKIYLRKTESVLYVSHSANPFASFGGEPDERKEKGD